MGKAKGKTSAAAMIADKSKQSFKKSKQTPKRNRWKKGHSCESNPSTRKHRERVSSVSFFQNKGAQNSLLTVENVRGTGMDVDGCEEDLMSNVESLSLSDAQSVLESMTSMKSAMSQWSKCSNTAFERFLSRLKMDSSLHKDMLSILSATSEVISEAGGKLNETEYFATFISMLENCDETQYQPLMALLNMVMTKVSQSVLQLKFQDIHPKLSSILSHAIQNQNELLIRMTVLVLAKLLKSQGKRLWADDNGTKSIIYSILKLTLHEKPKIRKKCRQTIGSLMTSFEGRESLKVTKVVIGWVMDQLTYFPTCEARVVTDAISLLHFCWDHIAFLNVSGAKSLFEAILRAMSSGDPSIIKIGLNFFASALQNRTALPVYSPENELLSKLIAAIWEIQSDWRNNETFIIWVRCILTGLASSTQQGSTQDLNYLPLLFEKLGNVWYTNQGSHVAKLMSEYLQHILDENTNPDVITALFKTLSRALVIVPPNPNCLRTLEALLDSLSPCHYVPVVKEVFLQLSPMKKSAPEVENVLGKFIKAFGVEDLWSSVGKEVQWLSILPLIKDNLSNGKLSFWKSHILTMYNPSSIEHNILWESLIGFCRNPSDPDNFPAELVGKVISEHPKMRLIALLALRQFIKWAQCRAVAVKYSKNFIPILLNLFLGEKGKKAEDQETNDTMGHGDAIGVTIQEYFAVCEPSFINETGHKALAKVSAVENGKTIPPALLDVVSFCAYRAQDAQLQGYIYSLAKAMTDDKDNSKRGYRMILALLKNEKSSTVLIQPIRSHLKAHSSKIKSNVEALRLECIETLAYVDTSVYADFLPEIILQQFSANSKARKLSNRLVEMLCSNLKETEGSTEPILQQVYGSLNNSSEKEKIASIHFLTQLYRNLRPSELNTQLVQSVISELGQVENGNLLKEYLNFISANLTIYGTQLGPFAASIGSIIAEKKDLPRKETNKVIVRMMKVFGKAGLKAVLPNSDEPQMRTRLRNINRKLMKLKEGLKKKEASATRDPNAVGVLDDEDDESEGEDTQFAPRNSSSESSLVLKEGLVDFLDPKNISSSLVSGPAKRKRKAEDDFKMAPDGRLLITDGDEDSGEEEDEFLGTNDMDNDDDDEADILAMEKMIRANKTTKKKGAMSVASKGSKFSSRSAVSHMSFKTTSTARREKKQPASHSHRDKRRKKK